MGVVYGGIISVLWSRARNKIINKNMAKVKIRVVKMMVLIVITYFITWGPKLILKTMKTFLFASYVSEEDENEGSTGGWGVGLCSRHFFASWAHIYNIF